MKIAKKWEDIKYILKVSWCILAYKWRDVLMWFVDWRLLCTKKLALSVEKIAIYCDEFSNKIEEEEKEKEMRN